ncbi:MAG: prolipoprotein diacylglyceryl transferase [Bacteroidia bacterium]|nr:prolipoprotein diacylglyceryl transferase [Bacteroidia bacterium]
MYPRISDLFNDLFGTSFCLPIQSFGFFVALAFLAAFYVIDLDLRRKEGRGIFPSRMVPVTVGGPMPLSDVLWGFGLFGLLGYKLGLMFVDYAIFCENPQQALLSVDGWFPGAVILGGLVGGWRLYLYQKKKADKPQTVQQPFSIRQEMGTIITIAFVAGLLGAKIFHNLEYWDDFIRNPGRALLSFDGLTFYGGLIVAGVSIAWYVARKGYPVLPFADSVAPGLMLGYGVGRIGCQMAGDGDWGIINEAPKPGWLSWAPDWVWAFDYPNNVLRTCNPSNMFYPELNSCDWESLHRLAKPVFPTPFYEVLMALALFGVLWLLRKRLPYWGQLSGIYLMLNGIERFLVEKIRVNSVYHLFGADITQAELISGLLFLGGLTLFALATWRWKYRDPQPA